MIWHSTSGSSGEPFTLARSWHFVLLGGELCTPLMRRHISEAFQAPAYQTYAATEFNLVGWSCPQSGLFHLCDPTVLVEVLDNQGNPVAEGKAGVLAATALHSRVMPFVRFALGDRVVKGPTPCPCGAPYGTLQSIGGWIWTKTGNSIYADAWCKGERSLNTPDDIRQKTRPKRDATESLYVLNEGIEIREQP